MGKTELLEYLAMVIDMEQNLNLQKDTYSKLSSNIKSHKDSLEDAIDKKNRLTADLSGMAEPKEKKKSMGSLVLSVFGFILLSIGLSIPLAIISCLFLLFIRSNPAYGLIFSYLVSLPISIIVAVAGKNNDKQKYRDDISAYNRKKLELGTCDVVVSDSEKAIEKLSKQIDGLTAVIADTEKGLKMLYDCGFLQPQYRCLDHVVLIYDYLDTGRCDKLDGSDGAYNKTETDQRLNTVSERFRTITENFGDIRGILSGMRDDLNRLRAFRESQGFELSFKVKMPTPEEGDLELDAYEQTRLRKGYEYADRIKYLREKDRIDETSQRN